MVYSPELGYDPDEWEECAEGEEHFLALSLFTRVCLGIFTVLLAFLFFWILEMNKRKGRNKVEEEEGEGVATEVEPWRPLEDIGQEEEEEEELSAETRLEKASQEAERKARPERRHSSKRELSKEEEMAILEWKAEVHKVEQERMRASEEPAIEIKMEEGEENGGQNGQLGGGEKDEGEEEGQWMPMMARIHQERKEEEGKDRWEGTDGAGGIPVEMAAHREQEKLQLQSEPISSTSIIAKSSEEIRKTTYDDDLLPADASAASHQQMQQQLKKARELQPSPLLLGVPKPKDLARLHAEFAPGATPPSTPPGGVPLAEQLPELAAHYRQMADELTRKLLEELDEMDAMEADAQAMAVELQNRHRGRIDGALEEAGAPKEVRQQLARQLETHMATVVSQEMRRRSSSTALLPKSSDVKAEEEKEREEKIPQEAATTTGKKGSSSSEEGFVKIRTNMTEEKDGGVSDDASPLLATTPSSPPLLLIEHRLTPSPQMGMTTDEEEPDQAGGIRVSLLSAEEGDGDGMSTTADDIEFVPSARPSPLPPVQQQQQKKQPEMEHIKEKGEKVETTEFGATKLVEKQHRRLLDTDEAEQVMALLQEYELKGETEADGEEEEEDRRGRQFSSGAASSVGTKISSGCGGVISLPESAQRTPGSSVPETPGSLGFDFVTFPIGGGQEGGAAITTIESAPSGAQMENQQKRKTSRTEVVEEQQQQKVDDGIEGEAKVLGWPKLPMESEGATTLRKEGAEAMVIMTTAVVEQKEKVEAQFRAIAPPPTQHHQNVPPSSNGQEGEEQMGEQQKAEKFLQDALAYMEQTSTVRRKSGGRGAEMVGGTEFVVEEEMLESEEGGAPPQKRTNLTPKAGRKEKSTKVGESTTAGADGTSKQIRTNEVFDKPDPMLLFDDIDDRDITYAPEIQSMEVPPDQLSQADSLNLVDENFSEHHELPGTTAAAGEDQQKGANENWGQNGRRNEEEEGKGAREPGMDEKDYPEEMEAREEEEGGQGRELTPSEEAELQREIDLLRRTPSPRPPKRPQAPQAPQFLRNYFNEESTSSGLDSTSFRQSSLLSAVGVSSTQEMLLKLTSLQALSQAMRKAGLESSNLIFGIDYTASNKYQGERSFGGRSLHSVADKTVENPYQQVINIMGRTLAPFSGTEYGIPVFGFGDSSTGDWSVFPLNGTAEGECSDLDDVLRVYNRITPDIDLSGPTNFAPLIYRSMEICHKRKDYHILVIIADGQVTNERATRKAIVSACQYPLSIIVVGVGDGPWDMMRVFDESLPKRPWDNFHFVEFHALITEKREELTMQQNPELAFAVHSLLEIPDQYNTIRKLGMLLPTYYTRPQPHSPRSHSPRPQLRK